MGYGDTLHVPVLAEEIIEMIGVRADGVYCDATLGGGGFTRQLIGRLGTGRLVCLDRDAGAVENVRRELGDDPRLCAVHANFECIAEVWRAGGWTPPDGIVYDLGLSSIQLEDGSRGMSFQVDSPLDMRLDPDEDVADAAEIVNSWSAGDLAALFREHGEMNAGRIARRIVRERESAGPVLTTGRLASVVASVAGRKKSPRHPATKVFLALRMAVNREAECLRGTLGQALEVVARGGKIAVISYQSVEDGIVKDVFRRAVRGCGCSLPPDECLCMGQPTVRYLHKGVVVPSEAEVEKNPRARSAKLRIIERI